MYLLFKRNNMINIEKFLMSINKWFIVTLGFLVMLLLLVITTLVTSNGNALNNPSVSYLDNLSILETFIESVITAPVLETLIFQIFIYWCTSKLISNKKYFLMIYLISSSLLFAISHYYSVSYLLYTICCGAVLSYSYFIFKERKENAFVLTVLIHSIFNFILFGIGIFIT